MSRVLIVDDEPDNLAYLSALLEGSGFTVDVAHHGVEALNKAGEHPPDAVISDLLMPDMDGFSLLRVWKNDQRLRSIPFLVFTATYGDSADQRLALDLGAAAFLLKPMEPQILLAQLRQILDRPPAPPDDTAQVPESDETVLLQRYNHALIRKLEDKTRQLEASNRELLGEIVARDAIAQKLRDSEASTLLLLNSTAEGIYGLDIEGVCTFCNPAAARFLGFAHPKEIVGQRVHERLHHSRADGKPLPLIDCPVHGAFGDGTATHGEEIFSRRDGAQFPVEYWTHPIRSGGMVIGAVVTFLDISERRNLEAQFLQSQKMEAIGRLAGGVAHDFNNSLQVVLMCSEMLDELLGSRPVEREFVREIQGAANQGSLLTRDLLAFSRKQLVRPMLLDLNTVVGDMLSMLRRVLGGGVEVTANFQAPICAVEADNGQMEQILMNLAINARDAMPLGGELRIATSTTKLGPEAQRGHPHAAPGQYAVLSVGDTGCGMDAGTVSRVFEPFFTTKEPGKGTGLGLSTVYGIVKQNRGFIEVDTKPGQGALFRICLPAVDGLPQGAIASQPNHRVGGGESILFVEDEAPMLTLMSGKLRAGGYRVLEASTGGEGVAIGEDPDAQIDLLVTDVILPDLSGPQVADKLLKAHPAMKVLYISGYSEDHLSYQGVAQGKMLLLQKPFSIAALLAKIREVLDGTAQRACGETRRHG